jgi:hypothetical protein
MTSRRFPAMDHNRKGSGVLRRRSLQVSVNCFTQFRRPPS